MRSESESRPRQLEGPLLPVLSSQGSGRAGGPPGHDAAGAALGTGSLSLRSRTHSSLPCWVACLRGGWPLSGLVELAVNGRPARLVLLTSTYLVPLPVTVRAVNTDSPPVVLRSGSLYFGAWPPSLRERPSRGAHPSLHGRVRHGTSLSSRVAAATATAYLAMLNVGLTAPTAAARSL